MTVRSEKIKRSAEYLAVIKSAAMDCGWLTSEEISAKLGHKISSNIIGAIISHAIKLNKLDCFVYCEYIHSDHKSWLFTNEELPLKKSASRMQAFRHAVDEKKLICESFCGKDWFFSHEAASLLGVETKKAGGVLRSLNDFGFPGYVVNQKTIQLRWIHRVWKIEKDEPKKVEPTFLSKRWV